VSFIRSHLSGENRQQNCQCEPGVSLVHIQSLSSRRHVPNCYVNTNADSRRLSEIRVFMNTMGDCLRRNYIPQCSATSRDRRRLSRWTWCRFPDRRRLSPALEFMITTSLCDHYEFMWTWLATQNFFRRQSDSSLIVGRIIDPRARKYWKIHSDHQDHFPQIEVLQNTRPLVISYHVARCHRKFAPPPKICPPGQIFPRKYTPPLRKFGLPLKKYSLLYL
jgi:hypothetical protein